MIAGSSMRKILLAIFAVLFSWPALAQQDYGNVTGYSITTCGSPPVGFTSSSATMAYPGPLTIDANGFLCIHGSVTLTSPSGVSFTPAAASQALAANQVIKGSAGNLFSFEVSADATLSAAAWWVMIYDATSAPGDGAVTPAKCYAYPANTTSASYAWPTPIAFATGITIGVSTTGCFTKTASTHAFISGDAK